MQAIALNQKRSPLSGKLIGDRPIHSYQVNTMKLILAFALLAIPSTSLESQFLAAKSLKSDVHPIHRGGDRRENQEYTPPNTGHLDCDPCFVVGLDLKSRNYQGA